MKYTKLTITFLALAAFTVGCNKEQTSQQIDKVKTETAAAVQDMEDYTFAQKAEFVGKMQGQLDALDKDLDQLSAKIGQGGGQTQTPGVARPGGPIDQAA
jgi:hypothetical protein